MKQQQSIHPAKLALGIITPLITAGAAWLCAAVAKWGVHLDPTGVASVATAGASGAVAVALKLIHDVESRHPAVARDIATIPTIIQAEGPQIIPADGWPPPAA